MILEKSDLREIGKIVDGSVTKAKKEILDVLGKEVSDLADINRAVITKTDELDYRLKIVERRLGITVH